MIGICPLLDQRRTEDVKYLTSDKKETIEKGDAVEDIPLLSGDKKEAQAFQHVVSKYSLDFADGHLKTPVNLSLRLPSYSVDEELVPGRDSYRERRDRLKTWYKHAKPPSAGIYEQEFTTSSDAEALMAREIPSESFNVDLELVQEIEDIWSEYFMPRSIRVEPSKIQVYGAGGHVDLRDDSADPNLVGKVLVRLGDDTFGGELEISGHQVSKTPDNSWLAFYSDAPFKVTKVQQNYGAVIFFNVYKTDEAESPQGCCPRPLRDAAERLVRTLEPPFGLLLERKYCLGTRQLSSIDSFIASCARAREDVKVYIIPVMICQDKFANFIPTPPSVNGNPQIYTEVYPFTKAVIDDALGTYKNGACDKWKNLLDDYIAFYDIHGEGSLLKWDSSEERVNGAATRETTNYLAYALLCLPVSQPGSDYESSDEDGSNSDVLDSDSDDALSVCTDEGLLSLEQGKGIEPASDEDGEAESGEGDKDPE